MVGGDSEGAGAGSDDYDDDDGLSTHLVCDLWSMHSGTSFVGGCFRILRHLEIVQGGKKTQLYSIKEK